MGVDPVTGQLIADNQTNEEEVLIDQSINEEEVLISEPIPAHPFTEGCDSDCQIGHGDQPQDKDKEFKAKFHLFNKHHFKKFKTQRLNFQINMRINFDRGFNVQHFETEIDNLYADIIKRIRKENPFNEDARYWINVSDTTSATTRFCLGDRSLNQYDSGELFRTLFKISQSNQEFCFRKFILDVYVYDSGSAAKGWKRRMDRNRAPAEYDGEENSYAYTNIKNKGMNMFNF